LKIAFRIAVALMLIGAIDPMEGSIVIALASVLLGFTAFKLHDRHRFIFMGLSISICLGVICLWWVSALGGFVPSKEWWWIAAIVPYPAGWLSFVALMVFRLFRWVKSRSKAHFEEL
jgi:hypothetical protein